MHDTQFGLFAAWTYDARVFIKMGFAVFLYKLPLAIGLWDSGTQTWSDGSSFAGHWKANIASGLGRFSHSDGEQVVGVGSERGFPCRIVLCVFGQS